MARGLRKSLSQHEAIDEFMVGYRNRAWSARAWLCRKERFRHHHALADFEAGFRAGYEAIAEGGSGCVPAVCPQAYWGWQYQSADGQSRMNAWFEGFPLGVQAAEEDGVGHWNHVATAFAAPVHSPQPPTGAVLAVPPVPDAQRHLHHEHGGTSLLPSAAPPERLPAPLLESASAPDATPELPTGLNLIEN